MYSEQVLDHFQHPRNTGEVSSPDAEVQLENPACGDVLKLTVKMAGGVIGDIRFLAKGCVPAIACASALTELVKGKPVAVARSLRRQELLNALGGVPQASTHAADLALDALNSVLRRLPQLPRLGGTG